MIPGKRHKKGSRALPSHRLDHPGRVVEHARRGVGVGGGERHERGVEGVAGQALQLEQSRGVGRAAKALGRLRGERDRDEQTDKKIRVLK